MTALDNVTQRVLVHLEILNDFQSRIINLHYSNSHSKKILSKTSK